MSQQPLDLRKSIAIIRRLKVMAGLVSAVGFFVGVAYGAVNPPGVSSTTVVSLPASVRSTATEVVIASSDPVLSAAAARINLAVPVAELRSEIQVTSPTDYLLSITATTASASDSEAIANAVAESYISYVGNPRSPVATVSAEIFQSAVTAAPRSLLESILIAGSVGALVGAIVGCVAALAVGRRDRRLRDRDQIANSIGLPVLASVPVAHPADPAGWAELVENYQPQAVHAWQLRTVLRYFGIGSHVSAQLPGDGAERAAADDHGMSLSVVSLSADPGALALGPQLAAFAASQGLPTALVVGPQQDAGAAAALRTACTALSSPARTPSLLRIVVSGEGDADQLAGVELSVVVVVVDEHAPKVPASVRSAAIVLGVSAGRVTAEQLARAAVAAGADGREVAGIIVADPEPTDKTTGRVPQLVRPPRRRAPNRLKGVVMEGRR